MKNEPDIKQKLGIVNKHIDCEGEGNDQDVEIAGETIDYATGFRDALDWMLEY